MKFILKQLIPILVLLATSSSEATIGLDRSAGIFFPEELRPLMEIPRKFPVFWYGVIAVDNDAEFLKSQKICRSLQGQEFASLVSGVFCDFDRPGVFVPLPMLVIN